ncbi:MAG: radical SAM protein [Cellulosilyticum sp.]|nr:radical SAM protein [Cellulosilyticum sp.]
MQFQDIKYHEVEVKGILSPKNGMNLYRGCQHGCIYCDARSTCYQMRHAFEDIEVKANAILLLEKALKSKRNPCMIGTGAMSDPYIPLEHRYGHMRRCLELIEKYGYGVAIQTKSDLILRDIDLLKEINQKAKCVVQMTLTTYDENLCKIIEPNVATTKRRVEILKIMRDAGIPTVVWLDPILPFINDTKENLEGIMAYCNEAKVYGILCFGFGLTLREGNREYFYQKLDEHFSGLKEEYIKRYGNAYEVNSPYNKELMQHFKALCKVYHIESNTHEIFRYMHTYEQKGYTQLRLDI